MPTGVRSRQRGLLAACSLTLFVTLLVAEAIPSGAATADLQGKVSIPVFLCGPSSFSGEPAAEGVTLYPPTDRALTNVVTAWNRFEAPWYSWQSSDVFNVDLVKGGVISIPPDEWYSDKAYYRGTRYNLPELCSDEATKKAPSGPKMYIVSELPDTPAGWAVVGGNTIVAYVDPSHDLTRSVPSSLTTSDYRSDNDIRSDLSVLLSVMSHEIDHAILGLHHISDPLRNRYGVCGLSGTTRYFEGLELSSNSPTISLTIGGLERIINDGMLLNRLPFDVDILKDYTHLKEVHLIGLLPDQFARGMLGCQTRRELGWPVGPGSAVCSEGVKAPPPLDLLSIERTSTGDPIIDIRQRQDTADNIAGYIISLDEYRKFDSEELALYLLFQGYSEEGPLNSYRHRNHNWERRYSKQTLGDVNGDESDWTEDRNSSMDTAVIVTDLVGETLCSRLECINQAFVNFRIVWNDWTYMGCSQEGVCEAYIRTLHRVDLDGLPFTLTGLTPGTDYRIRIAAYSENGVSEFSPIVEFRR